MTLRVLYLLPFWPHLYTPFLFREMAWLRQRGHRVAVVSLRRWPDGQPNVDRFGLNDVPVLQAPRLYPGDAAVLRQVASAAFTPRNRDATSVDILRRAVGQAGLRQGLHEWSNWRRILAFVKAQGSQIIDAHWGAEAAETALRIKAAMHLPVSVTFHGGDLCQVPSPALSDILTNANLLQPVSQYLADLLLSKRSHPRGLKLPEVEVAPQRLAVRPHGLPPEAFAKSPPAQNDHEQIIATAGRLDPEKGQMDLLEAAAPLAGEFRGMKLRFIGGGQLAQPLKDRAAALGIADRVEITGPLPWDQVLTAMRGSHLYVQASHVEGFGMTLLEAAGQGLPLIATHTGAHGQIIDQGGQSIDQGVTATTANGFMFEPRDIEALRGHLRTMLSDAALRAQMGAASLARARKHFLFDTLMPTVEARLQRLAQGG